MVELDRGNVNHIIWEKYEKNEVAEHLVHFSWISRTFCVIRNTCSIREECTNLWEMDEMLCNSIFIRAKLQHQKCHLHRIEEIGSSLAALKRLQKKTVLELKMWLLKSRIEYETAITFDMSSSWLAKCARQWTQEYVRFVGGKYAWNVLTILVLLLLALLAELLAMLEPDATTAPNDDADDEDPLPCLSPAASYARQKKKRNEIGRTMNTGVVSAFGRDG